MIIVKNLSRTFKREIKESGIKGNIKSFFNPQIEEIKAVDNISFNVDKGEILGFIGSNGAGKSTTIKMMTGILTPSSGVCEINGLIPYKHRRKYVKDIGVVFGQRTQLWWDLPLNETFEVLKEIYEIDEKVYKSNMSFFNEVLDISGFIKKPVRTLSLGQRMRADIAAALLHNPKVLFLDEPTIGLDVVVKEKMRKAIKQINENFGTTVVLTTHDMSDIEYLADKIIMIDKGKLVFEGSTNKLRNLYGQGKRIDFEVNGLTKINLLKEQIKKNYDVNITQEENHISILLDASKLEISEIVTDIFKKIKVSDISVSDVSIDEVVKKVYSRGGIN